MVMGPRLRKFALTAHIVSSVGWIGAVLAYLALVVAALGSDDDQTVIGAVLAMEWTYWALVALAFAALLSGVVQAFGTPWGLFRHYWVLFKLGLTIFAAVVLLMNMQTVAALAEAAAQSGSAAIGSAAAGQLLHAGGGLLVLLAATILAVYKPRGMTRHGWRQHQAGRATTGRAG